MSYCFVAPGNPIWRHPPTYTSDALDGGPSEWLSERRAHSIAALASQDNGVFMLHFKHRSESDFGTYWWVLCHNHPHRPPTVTTRAASLPPQPFHIRIFLLPSGTKRLFLSHPWWLCSPLDWIRWPSLNPIKSLCDTWRDFFSLSCPSSSSSMYICSTSISVTYFYCAQLKVSVLVRELPPPRVLKSFRPTFDCYIISSSPANRKYFTVAKKYSYYYIILSTVKCWGNELYYYFNSTGDTLKAS